MNKALTMTLAAAVLAFGSAAGARAGDDRNDAAFSEVDHIDMNVDLSPGAAVTVNDIAGPVTIETSDSSTAEVHVTRSARSKAELEKKKIVVDHSASSLTIQTEPHHDHGWDHANVRQSVTLRLPRSVTLRINDIAGRVKVDEIDGDVRISDVAGSLEVGRVSGSPAINDIAGSVSLSVGRLGEAGLRINDIAGRVELVVDNDTNADIDVSDVSGQIDVGAASVSLVGKVDPERFNGKIGAGGPRISISDIAGSVTVRN